MTGDRPSVDKLAAAVLARRKELRLRQKDVEARGGPTARTLQKLEKGTIGALAPRTLDALDEALRWTAGSASLVLYRGATPTRIEDVTPTDPESIRRVREFRKDIRSTLDRMAEEQDPARISEGLGRLGSKVDEILDRAVAEEESRVLRAQEDFFTRQLEATRSITPALEAAFGHLLVDSPDLEAAERTEVLYRRWLIGRTQAGELSAGQETWFEERFTNRPL